jgi:hypothetical protein
LWLSVAVPPEVPEQYGIGMVAVHSPHRHLRPSTDSISSNSNKFARIGNWEFFEILTKII